MANTPLLCWGEGYSTITSGISAQGGDHLARAMATLLPHNGQSLVLDSIDFGFYQLNPNVTLEPTIDDLATPCPNADHSFALDGPLVSPLNLGLTSIAGFLLRWGPKADDGDPNNLRYHVVPEPGAAPLLLAGLVGLACRARRRAVRR